MCFLTVQLHPASFHQPLADWICTPCSAAGFKTKPNKRSVCVGSVEDKGQFLRVKTRRVVAAASSCLQRKSPVISGRKRQVDCDSADPDHLLRLALFILIRKLTACNPTALPLNISRQQKIDSEVSWFGCLAAAHFLKKYFESRLEEPLGSDYCLKSQLLYCSPSQQNLTQSDVSFIQHVH